jgi:hypothetical protein
MSVLTGHDLEVKLSTGETDENFTGWFCLATGPHRCPAHPLTILHHVTHAHKIVVWPAKDDPNILRVASVVQDYGRKPRIVEYNTRMGECISYYELAGRKAHT